MPEACLRWLTPEAWAEAGTCTPVQWHITVGRGDNTSLKARTEITSIAAIVIGS